MDKLLEGVARYTDEVHGTKQSLFNELATGQAPPVLFLTCADSRIDPSLITQTDPGDLFVIRNAGNIAPAASVGLPAEGTIASIEFGVKALKVSTIVVCGHADCGAVKGAMNPEGLGSLPQVAAWVAHADTGGETDVDAAIEANVVAQMANLRTYDFITEAEAAGTLAIQGWVYDIASGVVRIHNGSEFADHAAVVGDAMAGQG